MGGLINPSSSPKSQPTVATVAPAATTAATTAAAVAASTEQQESQRRKEALERQRTGRASTIVTSSRGFLVPIDWTPQRKSLLGE